jgi:methanogenic corrinoid protein MtbC1
MNRVRSDQAESSTAGIGCDDGDLPSQRVGTRAPRASPNGRDDHLLSLVQTIETEIIPRLMMAHQIESKAGRDDSAMWAGVANAISVEEFANLLLLPAEGPARDYLEAARTSGFGAEGLYLDLLGPTARRLGYLWEEDLCSFADVTIGLSRLHRMLLELGPAFRGGGAPDALGRRVLLAAAPGEQHTFGLFMVGEFFRREGWEVWGEPIRSAAELENTVRDTWFEVVGLSAGTLQLVEDLRLLVATVRKASRNRKVVVMVGGPLFALHPEYFAKVGADAFGTDAREAVDKAEAATRNARFQAAG